MAYPRFYCFSKIGLFIFIITALTGCATVDIPKIGQEGYGLADDERRMHKRALEMTEELDDSGYIYQDKELEGYLTDLANRLLPADIRSQNLYIKVKVLSEPSLNAFAMPNGAIYVHTGMLAAIDNEAQLATLLAHELSHIIGRHSLKEFRSVINKSAFFSTLQAPAAAFGGDLGAIFTQLAVVSSIYGYSRNLEEGADREGFAMVFEQGYDCREALKLFEHLKQFIDDEEIKQPFFFSTHPNVVARIKNYERLIKEKPQTGEGYKSGASEYGRMVNLLLLNDVELCLQEGKFRTAEKIIEGFLRNYPDEAQGYSWQGELFRQRQDHGKKEKQRAKQGDYVKALEAFEKATNLDPDFAEAYRGKGRVLQSKGESIKAKEAFKKYLELNPGARDRGYIEKIVSSN